MNKRYSLLTIVILLSLLCIPGGGRALASTPTSVVAWGYNLSGQATVPPGLSDVVAVAAGAEHSLALKADGTIVAWGCDDPYGYGTDVGQCTVPAELTGVTTAIAAGWHHNLALKINGTVVAWGDNYAGKATVPDGLTGVTAISAGIDHSLALKNDGNVVAWGDNFHGQTSVPAGLSNVTAISANGYHSLALKSDGTVVAWGWDNVGQCTVPADLTSVTAVAAGSYHSLALKSDGTVVAWGNNGNWQATVPAGLTGVTAISAGAYHSLALKSDGTVVGWGSNDESQIDTPDAADGAIAISAGYGHNLAIAPLAAETPPAVTEQPADQLADVGDKVSFSAAASGDPAPTVQWQVSYDGTEWTDIPEATASPFTFAAAFGQNGTQYRAVFTNSAGSATSSAATLTVKKMVATITLSDLTQTFSGEPKHVMVNTEPAGLEVKVVYGWDEGLVPIHAGEYAVDATIIDPIYAGTASDTLFILPKPASVTPADASRVYGEADPTLTGILEGFLPRDTDCSVNPDCVRADYDRETGEGVGAYPIRANLWSMSTDWDPRDNYAITYNTATFTIAPRPIEVTADAQTKFAGEADPQLTYQVTGALSFNDAFSGDLARDPGEDPGVYAIRQGTLVLNDNYTLTYVGADLTIVALATNDPPVASAGGPYLGAINTAITFDGSASSDAEGGPLTYAWTFGDGATGTGATPIHSYAAAAIQEVCLTVNDGELDSLPACAMAVVYDPSAGFVTGSGWILSPAGAYKPDTSLSGPATFGFVSKYKKGASVPEGSSEFAFEAAGFNFASTSYDWLVVSKDQATAQFKGLGTVNGAMDPNANPYKFMLWAGDGTGAGGADTFRIHIWWEAADGVHEVYDNGFAEEIGGGNVLVHTGKVKDADLEDDVSQGSILYLPLINAD